MTGGEKEMLSVRMPFELGAALRAHAYETGESLSDVLRRAALLVLGRCPTCERNWPQSAKDREETS